MNKLTSKTVCGHCELHFEGSMSMLPFHNCQAVIENRRDMEVRTGVKQVAFYHDGFIALHPKY